MDADPTRMSILAQKLYNSPEKTLLDFSSISVNCNTSQKGIANSATRISAALKLMIK